MHIDYCATKIPQTKIPDFKQQRPLFTTKKIPASVKSDVADVLLLMCAKDTRPFSTAEGDGFKDMAKKMISIGATYGKIDDIDEILPCATTISRHLDSNVATMKSTIQKELTTVPQFGITTDLWTHGQSNHSYVTVTIQYVKKCEVTPRILATRILDEKHSAENVRDTVNSILDEFGAHRPYNVFVTDNASNMKAAFRDTLWSPCACHCLNLVLSHSFNDKPTDEANDGSAEGLPHEVAELIDTCKEIVTLAKRSKMNNQLEKTLKQCVETRWNSKLTMLKSVLMNLEDLRKMTSEASANRKLRRLVADVNELLLADVISVLEPFDTATKMLSTDRSPTLQLVAPTKVKLAKHLGQVVTDSAVIADLKKHMTVRLEKHFTVIPLHYTAAVLDPRLKKNASVLPPQTLASAIESLKLMVANANNTESNLTAEPSTSTDTELPSNKKARLETSFLCDIFSAREPTSAENEVDAYLNTGTADPDINLLEYWESQNSSWPKLSVLAMGLLGVPASSTSSERTFSLAGRTLEDRRSQLSGDTVDGLLFLHGLQNQK